MLTTSGGHGAGSDPWHASRRAADPGPLRLFAVRERMESVGGRLGKSFGLTFALNMKWMVYGNSRGLLWLQDETEHCEEWRMLL